MRPITSLEMAIADENASFLGIPRLILMENAGRAVAEALLHRLGDIRGRKVVVVAGLGNNGGDGLVAARHLACMGARVSVILLGHEEDIRTAEAKKNWAILKNMLLSMELFQVRSPEELSEAWNELGAGEADAIIDAIFGTGLRGRVRSPFSEAIELINASKALVVAVDIPSGLNPDTGEPSSPTVRADITVCMHRLKPGLLEAKARPFVGELIVADIGMPPEAELIVGPGDLKAYLKPRRPPHSKKGDFGRILIVGGSPDYSGAPALSALAALRAGSDLAIVAAPRTVADVIRAFSPNLIVRPLRSDRLSPPDVPDVLALARRSTSMVIGPGLGTDEATFEAVLEIISKVARSLPLVIDADAIKALASKPIGLSGSKAVITPHAGEFKLLSGAELPRPGDLEGRMKAVEELANRLGTVILLKAHEDIISDGKRTKLNVTGNPGMTVGGTGDVLTGVVASLLSKGLGPFEAACIGAFVNGMAGDIAVRELGYHILATDVIERIPIVLKAYERVEPGSPSLRAGNSALLTTSGLSGISRTSLSS